MPQTLRVMTFNIRGFYHPGDGSNQWRHREALHFAMLRQHAPDLIGVQEAQTGNLKAYHRELPGYHWMAWPHYGDDPLHEWPAIYWRPERVQPIDSGGFWLSETPDQHSRSWNTDCIRSASWVKFRCTTSGATIVHLNTHLDHVSEQARIEGAHLIIARLDEAQREGAAAIVTGDFNTTPGSATHALFAAAGFTDAHTAAGNATDPQESYTNHGWRGYPFNRPEEHAKAHRLDPHPQRRIKTPHNFLQNHPRRRLTHLPQRPLPRTSRNRNHVTSAHGAGATRPDLC